MPRHNDGAIRLLTGRWDHSIRSMHRQHADTLTEADSDTLYDSYRRIDQITTAALTRAPEIKPGGIRVAFQVSTDMGNVLIHAKRHMTADERKEYDNLHAKINDVCDTYEG